MDRLIALSEHLSVEMVEVASIAEIDSVYWFDHGNERPTVRRVVDHFRLIQDVDLSYPILLGADGRVMDGMHRIARALLEGRTVVAAKRFITHPAPDYRDVQPGDLPYD